jgi:hypothetical protein
MPSFGIDTFSLLLTAFWVWMLIDCLFNQRARGGNKLFWFLFILFVNPVGAVIYYFMKCTMRNPIDAFPYYLRTLKGAFQSSGPTMPSSPYQPRPTPQPQQPRPPQSPPVYIPPSYTQGYRAQTPARPAPAEQNDTFQPYQPQAMEPEYEQPLASYPEMELPPQE